MLHIPYIAKCVHVNKNGIHHQYQDNNKQYHHAVTWFITFAKLDQNQTNIIIGYSL